MLSSFSYTVSVPVAQAVLNVRSRASWMVKVGVKCSKKSLLLFAIKQLSSWAALGLYYILRSIGVCA